MSEWLDGLTGWLTGQLVVCFMHVHLADGPPLAVVWFIGLLLGCDSSGYFFLHSSCPVHESLGRYGNFFFAASRASQEHAIVPSRRLSSYGNCLSGCLQAGIREGRERSGPDDCAAGLDHLPDSD